MIRHQLPADPGGPLLPLIHNPNLSDVILQTRHIDNVNIRPKACINDRTSYFITSEAPWVLFLASQKGVCTRNKTQNQAPEASIPIQDAETNLTRK
jgi:hypothetical protein